MKKVLIIFLCLMFITGCNSQSNNEYNDLKEEINTLKQKLNEQNNNEYDDLKEEINSLKQKVNEETNPLSLDEINQKLEDNKKQIEKLNESKKTLEDKIQELENANNSLTQKITSLENANSSLKSTIDSLKSNNYVNQNQYTITKDELIGSWHYKAGNNQVFTENNCDVIGNWIIYHQSDYDVSVYYMYKDGKLYITDGGSVYFK